MASLEDDVAAACRLLLPDGASEPQVLGLSEEDGVVSVEVDGFGELTLYVPDPYPGLTMVSGDDVDLEFDGTIAVVIKMALDALSQRKRVRVEAREQDSDDDPLDGGSPLHVDALPMEPLLAEHLAQVRRRFGGDVVECADMTSGWRVRLTLTLRALEGPTVGNQLIGTKSAEAWGIDPYLPLILEVHLPGRGYLTKSMGAHCVKAVWQPGNEAFQLEKQLLVQLFGFVSIVLGHDLVPVPTLNSFGGRIFDDSKLALIAEYDEWKAIMMSKAQADPSAGLLVHLLLYAQERVARMHQFCALCDQPFGLQPMIMRTVCMRPLCSHQLSEFGDKITSATPSSACELSELLFSLFERAASVTDHKRKKMVLDPYPQVHRVESAGLGPWDQSSYFFRKDGDQDYDALEATVRELSELRNAMNAPDQDGAAGASWTTMTSRMSESGAGLMQWLVATNRSYIAPLHADQRLAEFGTAYQYMMISTPPEKEMTFQGLKQQHGSFFAFHGSHIGNWHSILRNGLKNASNTPMMSAGAAYGAGIYMARASPISLQFSGIQVGRRGQTASRAPELRREVTGNRCIGSNAAVLAVCEVAKHPSVKQHNRYDAPFYVAPDEDTVVTRLLLVYADSGQDIDLTGELVDKINHLMLSLHAGVS